MPADGGKSGIFAHGGHAVILRMEKMPADCLALFALTADVQIDK
jgi:hypothetical protein